MKDDALKILENLMQNERESEVVEWKEAKTSFDFNHLGKYFSALSNEANLRGKPSAWFVMGVSNRKEIVGTAFKRDGAELENLKHDIAQHVSNRLSFREIYELQHPSNKRVLLFEIPPAPKGLPTSWQGHYYGRDGESLAALNIEKIERIRNQIQNVDWSIGICEDASITDLDSAAISKARGQFAQKNERIANEVWLWDDITFLNKAKLAIRGKITRAAVVLLGRPESESFLTPSIAKITWILKNDDGQEIDYAHFGPPWILNGEEVYRKIRNLRYRHMPDGSLFPIEVDKYDTWVLREALHNAMAHQDYTKSDRIALVEFSDRIRLSNAGSFIPESVEAIIESDSPSSRYRNRFLCDAMVNLNMIDTIGSGIRKMFQIQRNRFFPLPDYEIKPESVAVTIMGRILDPHYVQQLASKLNLPLHDVILLDKVQKGKIIEKVDAQRLRSNNLIEGRYPRLHISSSIAAISRQEAVYLHNRGLDNRHYIELIMEHIRQFGGITRSQADELLISKLPDLLNSNQKNNKVRNILASMVMSRLIKNIGSRPKPNYVLLKENSSSGV